MLPLRSKKSDMLVEDGDSGVVWGPAQRDWYWLEQVKSQPKHVVKADTTQTFLTLMSGRENYPKIVRFYVLWAPLTRHEAWTLQQLPRLHVNKHIEVFGTLTWNLSSNHFTQADSSHIIILWLVFCSLHDWDVIKALQVCTVWVSSRISGFLQPPKTFRL